MRHPGPRRSRTQIGSPSRCPAQSTRAVPSPCRTVRSLIRTRRPSPVAPRTTCPAPTPEVPSRPGHRASTARLSAAQPGRTHPAPSRLGPHRQARHRHRGQSPCVGTNATTARASPPRERRIRGHQPTAARAGHAGASRTTRSGPAAPGQVNLQPRAEHRSAECGTDRESVPIEPRGTPPAGDARSGRGAPRAGRASARRARRPSGSRSLGSHCSMPTRRTRRRRCLSTSSTGRSRRQPRRWLTVPRPTTPTYGGGGAPYYRDATEIEGTP